MLKLASPLLLLSNSNDIRVENLRFSSKKIKVFYSIVRFLAQRMYIRLSLVSRQFSLLNPFALAALPGHNDAKDLITHNLYLFYISA